MWFSSVLLATVVSVHLIIFFQGECRVHNKPLRLESANPDFRWHKRQGVRFHHNLIVFVGTAAGLQCSVNTKMLFYMTGVIIISDRPPVTSGIHCCLVGYDKARKPANDNVIPVPVWMTFFSGFTSIFWINKKRHTFKLATISDECRFWTWWTDCVEHPTGTSPATLLPKITLEVMRKSVLCLIDSGWDANIQPVCPTVVKVITDDRRWPHVFCWG